MREVNSRVLLFMIDALSWAARKVGKRRGGKQALGNLTILLTAYFRGSDHPAFSDLGVGNIDPSVLHLQPEIMNQRWQKQNITDHAGLTIRSMSRWRRNGQIQMKGSEIWQKGCLYVELEALDKCIDYALKSWPKAYANLSPNKVALLQNPTTACLRLYMHFLTPFPPQ